MSKYFLLLFLFLFGCINEQPLIMDDNEVQECEVNDLECFFDNIMNNHSSIVHFSSLTPIYDFNQYSKGYYRSNGCEENKCIFEVYYYEFEVFLSEEFNDELIELGYTQEEIDEEIQDIQNVLSENWKKNKVKCEMTRDEAQLYLKEFLFSKEGSIGFDDELVGSKRCEIVSR